MQRCQAALYELFKPGIASKFEIVVQSKEGKDEPVEHMRRRIDGDLFKKDAFIPDRRVDTTIENIKLKGVNNTLCSLEKCSIGSKLVCPYQDGEANSLSKRGQTLATSPSGGPLRGRYLGTPSRAASFRRGGGGVGGRGEPCGALMVLPLRNAPQ